MKLNFNYTLQFTRIKSNWFDENGVYKKIGYKGLNLYFQLFKFRIHNQDNDYTFITSISMLRKETGYSTGEVFNLLKKLKSAKVIKLENVSRWDYLLDENGSIKDKDILVLIATDTYKDEDKYYINIPFDLFKLYEEKGLTEKYYALYCLISKWSNNAEGKMWMSIEKMAKFLGFDKDFVNKMIYQLNEHYLMYSNKRSNHKNGYKFEHHLLKSAKPEDVEKFLGEYKDKIDVFNKRVQNNRNKKKQIGVEELLPIEESIEVEEEPVKLAFGTKTLRNTPQWEKINPFANENDEDKKSQIEEFEKIFG